MTALRIAKMLYGGEGATAAGETVPFVLPGELVSVSTTGGVTVLEPSADRVVPGCVHFGVCGGCQYQHAAYPAQLRMKEEILRETLGGAGLTELPEIEVHSGPEWSYRNRIRLRVGRVDGELRVGYNRHGAAGGEAMVPVAMCPIAAPLLWRAAEALLELAKTEGAGGAWMASATEVEMFTNADESALQLTLFTRSPAAGSFSAFCERLQGKIPQLTGAGVAMLPKNPMPRGRRFEQAKAGAQWGAPGLVYKVEGEKVEGEAQGYGYWVGRGGFFQVNRSLVARLAELATGGRSGEMAWDLYAGVGLFSRALTGSFARVTGVEAAEAAGSGLAAALKPPHRSLAMTTLDFLKAAVVQRERPELIVMDPPRAGVGAEVCGLLGRIGAPEVVYVSCDPVTLARDLKLLVGSGYRVGAVHLVDMFPQTFHVETVAVLRR